MLFHAREKRGVFDEVVDDCHSQPREQRVIGLLDVPFFTNYEYALYSPETPEVGSAVNFASRSKI